MKTLFTVVGATMLLLTSGAAMAKANVEITWENPEKFTDVKPTTMTRAKFREHTFTQLEEYIVELAEQLPDGQTLQMKVTNLDLAGTVWPASFIGVGNGGSDVRLVKSIDIPRMNFSYTLFDADKQVVKQAEVKLKDMAFQNKINAIRSSESLRYEKNMLKDWFGDEFPNLVAKN